MLCCSHSEPQKQQLQHLGYVKHQAGRFWAIFTDGGMVSAQVVVAVDGEMLRTQ